MDHEQGGGNARQRQRQNGGQQLQRARGDGRGRRPRPAGQGPGRQHQHSEGRQGARQLHRQGGVKPHRRGHRQGVEIAARPAMVVELPHRRRQRCGHQHQGDDEAGGTGPSRRSGAQQTRQRRPQLGELALEHPENAAGDHRPEDEDLETVRPEPAAVSRQPMAEDEQGGPLSHPPSSPLRQHVRRPLETLQRPTCRISRSARSAADGRSAGSVASMAITISSSSPGSPGTYSCGGRTAPRNVFAIVSGKFPPVSGWMPVRLWYIVTPRPKMSPFSE